MYGGPPVVDRSLSDSWPTWGWLYPGEPPARVYDESDVPGCRDGCPCTEPAAAAPLPAVAPQAWAVPGVPLERAEPVGSPLLAGLAGALDALEAAGPLTGSTVETLEVFRLAERARGLALRELAVTDTTGGHLVGRLRQVGLTGWLREARQLTDTAARSTVELARALRDDLPELAGLLQTGAITVEHATAVVAGVRGLDRQLVRDAQPGLCALALTCDPAALRARLREMAVAVDEQLAADAARRAQDRMGLRVSPVGDHSAVDGTLTGEDGATVRLALDLAVEADRVDGDPRSKAARTAQVLVDWASDYLQRAHGPGDSAANDAHTVRSHLLVVCTPEQLAARADDQAQRTLADLVEQHLTGGPGLAPLSPTIPGQPGPLSRGALRRLACDATLDLVLAHSSTGTGSSTGTRAHRHPPLHVGRSARTLSGAQFKALVARDRTCIVAGCHRPPAQCAGHHVQHWADGGTTDLDNLVLLCHAHHHDHHDRGRDLSHRDGRWLTQTGWAAAPP